MAHYAEIDENNIVLRVLVVNDEDTIDPETGEESESVGIAFCKEQWGGNWVQTSYNNNIRKRYAAIGYSYNTDLDAFVPPKPYESWVLNSETAEWESPIGPSPERTEEDRKTDSRYEWDESLYQSDNTQGWVFVSRTLSES